MQSHYIMALQQRHSCILYHGGVLARGFRLHAGPGPLRPGLLLHRQKQLHLPPLVHRCDSVGLCERPHLQNSKSLFRKAVGKDVSLSHEYFFFILLPPIVFSVGYTIKTEFFQHFLTIVFFGTVSTLLTIVAQGGLLFALKAYLIQSLTVREVLLITIITSVNDPISSLPLLRVSEFVSSPTRPPSKRWSAGKASSSSLPYSLPNLPPPSRSPLPTQLRRLSQYLPAVWESLLPQHLAGNGSGVRPQLPLQTFCFLF